MGGYMLGECGKPQSAMRFYRRALELDASLIIGHINFGKLLFAAGRFTEALASFETATKLAPHDPDAWCSRAGTLRELGRLEESVEAAERALELTPRFSRGRNQSRQRAAEARSQRGGLEAYLRQARRGLAWPRRCWARVWRCAVLAASPRLSTAFDGAAALGSREAIAGRGCLMLTLGDFENGLEGYEARWLKGKSIAEALGTRFPSWKGPGGKASASWCSTITASATRSSSFAICL